MAESRPVPCNLMSWPVIADLLPDQKLIIYHLWASQHTTPSGCYLLPMASFAAELGLSVQALQEAIRQFGKLGLVDFDDLTGEVVVLAWPRFQRKAGRGIAIIAASVAKIQSARLKQLVTEKFGLTEPNSGKSSTCPPTATATSTATSTLCMQGAGDASDPPTPPPGAVVRAESAEPDATKKHRAITDEGVVVWTSEDQLAAARLVQRYGSAAVAAAAAALQAQGIDPLPGRVIRSLEQSAPRQRNLADPGYWVDQQQADQWAERVSPDGDDDDRDQ